MAWTVKGLNFQMCEGDYGIQLPITITGPTFTASDKVKLTIKGCLNGETIVEKDFSDISEATVNLELTEEESARMPAGEYVYSLDWYQDNAFLCNIIPAATLKVVDKA